MCLRGCRSLILATGALDDIYTNHHYSDSPEIAAAEAMNAGCDQNDGVFYAGPATGLEVC